MTKFLDGPAAGQILTLQRAPVMLRVVKGHAWDALDQASDSPSPRESIFVYRLASRPGMCHVSRRPRSQSGWMVIAEYKLWFPQPDDSFIRDNAAWATWCDSIREQVMQQLKDEGINLEVAP